MADDSQSKCLKDQIFSIPNLSNHYRGKVRDVYTLADGKLLMIASDRISAFDHVLPKAIPYKGQVLNQIAAYFLEATRDIVPNWFITSPDPNISLGNACEPLKVEMVVRGYLAGHAWRTYQSGMRELCGITLPEGLKQNDPFPYPIITPTTKATIGHDEDISEAELLNQNIVTKNQWEILTDYTLKLYQRGQQMAHERGLILVDTKYEFGLINGEIYLMDEIHTPDSSRYFYLDGYQELQDANLPQKQLSKEFVREWLMSNGFQGKDGQIMPYMPEEFVYEVSERYIELYELISGQKFVKADVSDVEKRIQTAINNLSD
jgi:phosphoribosylaminoimidazole-succinocarboxamide synthase